MAIDTAGKRRAILNRTLPWRGILPLPDGTFSSGDRGVLLYRALLTFAEAVVPAGVKIVSALMEGALQMELGVESELTMTFELE